MDDAWLTVEALARLLDRPLRTVRYRVRQWHARQASPFWPRVRFEAGVRGNARGRYLVERGSFDAFCAGETAPAVAA